MMINLSDIIRFTIQIFCIATMAAMGLGVSLQDIQSPFRKPLALALIVLVNNILVPLMGYFIIVIPDILQGGFFEDLVKAIVPLDDGQQMGFLILLLASGSLAGPLLARVAGATEDFARGLMVVLVGATAILMPFQLNLLESQTTFFPDVVRFEFSEVFMTLLIYQLLPLAVGILIGMQSRVLANLLKPLLVQLSTLTLLLLIGTSVLSSAAILSLPANPPLEPTANGAIVLPIEDPEATLDAATILQGVKEQLGANELPPPDRTAITATAKEGTWAIVDLSTTASVEIVSPTLTITLPSATKRVTVTIDSRLDDRIKELDDEQISTILKGYVDQPPDFVLGPEYLVIVLEKGHRWQLAHRNTTHFVDVKLTDNPDGYELTIYQKLPKPLGTLAKFLKTLEGLPVIGPVIDFITNVLIILIPYALLLAVALLLVEVGRLTGGVVQGMVGVTGSTIPVTVAVATGVRNVTMALVVIANYLLPEAGSEELLTLGQGAFALALIFFVINLIVAGRQAAQWGESVQAEKRTTA